MSRLGCIWIDSSQVHDLPSAMLRRRIGAIIMPSFCAAFVQEEPALHPCMQNSEPSEPGGDEKNSDGASIQLTFDLLEPILADTDLAVMPRRQQPQLFMPAEMFEKMPERRLILVAVTNEDSGWAAALAAAKVTLSNCNASSSALFMRQITMPSKDRLRLLQSRSVRASRQ